MGKGKAADLPRPDGGIIDSSDPQGLELGPDVEATIDLRVTPPVVELREAPAVERRSAIEQSRFVAVVVIAVLNVIDLITTYVAISHGAHEGNPVVAWMISSHVVVLAKIGLCGSLIFGVITARNRRRRVSLLSLCMAWAVVGVYSLVVVINSLTVWSHLR
jgi:hypothetical protein